MARKLDLMPLRVHELGRLPLVFGYRIGYTTRTWDTRAQEIPKITAGSYFPSLLEHRRRAEKALHAVVVEAYVKGASTRKVDDLVKARGIDGISKFEVSRICKVLDAEAEASRARAIDEKCPYGIRDAIFHKVRELDRVVSVACVVAVGVTATGDGRVLVDCEPSENERSGRASCGTSSGAIPKVLSEPHGSAAASTSCRICCRPCRAPRRRPSPRS